MITLIEKKKKKPAASLVTRLQKLIWARKNTQNDECSRISWSQCEMKGAHVDVYLMLPDAVSSVLGMFSLLCQTMNG